MNSKYTCYICGNTYNTKEDIISHLRKEEQIGRVFFCKSG